MIECYNNFYNVFSALFRILSNIGEAVGAKRERERDDFRRL